jgi:hypothetical protein
VETGVGSGVTTSFILHAMAANGEGRLWSIDLPPIGAEQFAGSFVPQPLNFRSPSNRTSNWFRRRTFH